MATDTRPEFKLAFHVSVVSSPCLGTSGKQNCQKITAEGQQTEREDPERNREGNKNQENPTRPQTDCLEHKDGKRSDTEPCFSQRKARRHTNELCGLVLCRNSPPSGHTPPSLGGRRCSLGESGIPTGARNPRGVLKIEATSSVPGGVGFRLQTNTGTWLPTLKSPEVPQPWWDGFVYPAFSKVPLAVGSRPCVPLGSLGDRLGPMLARDRLSRTTPQA